MNKKELMLGDYFETGKGRPNSKRSPTDHRLETIVGNVYMHACSLVSKVSIMLTQADL